MYRIALSIALFLLVSPIAIASKHSHSHPYTLASASASASRWMEGYTLILVDAASNEELADARDFITAQGGRVAIVLPPHAIYGWISPEVKSRIVGRHKIRGVYRSAIEARATGFTDADTRFAVKLFNDVVTGRLARQKNADLLAQSRQGQERFSPERPPMFDCSQPKPPMNAEDIIRNLQLKGAAKSLLDLHSQIEPNFFDNSNTMDGTVAVALFLMESTGATDPNIYDWSQSDQDFAIAQVIDGLNWWVDQSRAFSLSRPLQFTLVPYRANDPACQIPYEPVLRNALSANLWVSTVMNNLGVTSGDIFVRVASFDRIIRDQNRANWAFSIFLAYNPAPAPTSLTDGRASWAYLGGPHANILFRSYGWSLSQIVSHETGHIFYACDEYNQPGYQTCSCSCAPEVRPDARNGNCEEGSCNLASTSCMMRLNEFALCPHTAAQVGWTGAVLPAVPTAPSGLVASASSPTQINLTWQDTASNESGFQVERRGGSDANFSLIATTPANTSTYLDNSVQADTQYSYRVRAFNLTGASSYSHEATVTTPRTPDALNISTADLPEATVAVPYSRSVTAVGGRAPYRWVVESGTLPQGLAFSQFGEISGTPTTAGAFTFTVRVTDDANATTAKSLSLTVKPQAPLTITTGSLPRGSVGTTYSQQLGASGGQTPYSWSVQSGALPDGLTLNTLGILQGIPERAGTFSFVIRLTDDSGANASATLSLVINPPISVLTIETQSLADGVVGFAYSQTLRVGGGNSPYLWRLKSGTLPAGLTLSEAGVISGTPTAQGIRQFEVEVEDQSGQRASKQLDIDIEAPPQFTVVTESNLPRAAVGVPYRVELRATAGAEPYAWVKKPKPKFGNLPDGLTLTKATGVLAGTPTTQGSFDFTLIVNDSAGRQVRKPFTVEVGPPPPPLEIRTTSLPNGLQGLPYTATLEAGGGVAPYAWTLDVGTLPAGLTLAENGIISGSPTGIGSTTFVVRVRDAVGTSSTRSFFIIVSPPPPPLVIQTVSLPDTSAERAYQVTLQGSGGVPPYAWSLASGSLGAGLSLSASGVISGTPQNAGTVVFGVRLTDNAQQSVVRTFAIRVNPADKLAPFGALETPDHNTTLSNQVAVTGWALDNVGVVAVELLIDGQKFADATYGISRPDVGAVWGTFPNAGNAGFRFMLDSTKLTNGEHQLAVRVLDLQGNITVIGTRRVQVQNRQLSVTTTELLRGRRGDPYNFQLQAANGVPPYVWTLASGTLPQGLFLNVSGVISGTPSVFGTFPIAVRVNDAANGVAVASLTLTVQPDTEPLRIVSQGALTAGLTGVDYLHQLFFAGGTAPRTWSLNSGALPPGLTLHQTNGTISGRPTSVGNFTFTLRLTDATQTSAISEPLSIAVTPGPLVIVSSGDLTGGTQGLGYTHQLLFLGGRAPVTWSLPTGSALPPGLGLNGTTGIISGIPTTPGTYTFTVRVTDSQQPPATTISGTLRIIIAAPPLVITSVGDLTGGRVNQAYTHQLTFTGGVPPVTWSLPTGSTLPNGLTLNASTGVISGTPTQTGAFTFTVRVTDSANVATTSGNLRIIISP